MGEPVKKRPYTSTVRQEQAAQTRARILEAAGELFERDGYGRTTVAAVADRAEVAADTIYKTFGTKARVLTALIDQRLAPQEGVDNVMKRPEAQAVRDTTGQREQIAAFARDMTRVLERVGPVYEILRTASAVEPEMAALHAEMDGYRMQNMRRAAEWFVATGPMRVSVDEVAETLWVLASPDVGRMLRTGRGWTRDQHARWLEETLVNALLPDPPGTEDASGP